MRRFLPLVVLLFLITASLPLTVEGADSTPRGIEVTNITKETFTVTWWTLDCVEGHIIWGDVPTSLGNTSYDERGADHHNHTHRCTASTGYVDWQFYFKIVSNGVIYDNNGEPWAVHTLSPRGSIQNPHQIRGHVYRANGEPASGAIVYMTLTKDGIDSLPVSRLTDESGLFYFDLSEARWTEGSDGWAGGDIINIRIEGGNLGKTPKNGWNSSWEIVCIDPQKGIYEPTDLGNFSLIPGYPLREGWNIIAIPVDMGTVRAGDLAMLIEEDIEGNVTEISRWLPSGWVSWLKAVPTLHNFTLVYGESYFVFVNLTGGANVWYPEGNAFNGPVEVSFKSGWNLISAPYHTNATRNATDILNQVNSQNGEGTATAIANWTEMDCWEMYTTSGTNFLITDDWYTYGTNARGWFLRCTKSGTWTPE